MLTSARPVSLVTAANAGPSALASVRVVVALVVPSIRVTLLLLKLGTYIWLGPVATARFCGRFPTVTVDAVLLLPSTTVTVLSELETYTRFIAGFTNTATGFIPVGIVVV